MADPLLPGLAQATIPLVTDEDEDDSAYGGEGQSLTTSLASSIWEYHYENGRRYNAFRKGAYWYPSLPSGSCLVCRAQFCAPSTSHIN